MAVNSGLAAYPTAYTRVWAGAGGAIWRPVPPPGYVAAGDLFMAGEGEPELSAMVCVHGELALSWGQPAAGSGQAWMHRGGMGVPIEILCVSTHLGDWTPCRDCQTTFFSRVAEAPTPPCVPAEGTVVECAPGERLSLPPHLPHAPAAAAAATAALPRLNLWCLDNSMGTFLAATPSLPAPEATFDLRSPLGLTPAALLAMGAAQEVAGSALVAPSGRPRSQQHEAPEQSTLPAAAAPGQQQRQQLGLRKRQDPSQMFNSFQSSRRELRTDTAARLVTPSGEPWRRRHRCARCPRWGRSLRLAASVHTRACSGQLAVITHAKPLPVPRP